MRQNFWYLSSYVLICCLNLDKIDWESPQRSRLQQIAAKIISWSLKDYSQSVSQLYKIRTEA
jgi:hypothetical protein